VKFLGRSREIIFRMFTAFLCVCKMEATGHFKGV